jgi:hypothetical protein
MHRTMTKYLLPLLLALSAGLAQADTWRIALIGDTPYNDFERREFPLMLQAINAEHVDLVVHAGDFKHSRDACSDELFADRQRLFDASAAPFIYVPGDNEWSDCNRLIAGHHDPLERLAALRRIFMAGDESLGQRRLTVQRQTGEYREHQRWQLGPVLFASLNMPGGNNNYRLDGRPGKEAEMRMPQVLAWLRESFALARQENLRGIVIVMQANPALKRFRSGVGHGGYRALLEALREETLNFRGEVLLVHGDTHWQRIDQPLHHPVSGKKLANFTRVETFGYPYMGWVTAFIDTQSPRLFRFEARNWPKTSP